MRRLTILLCMLATAVASTLLFSQENEVAGTEHGVLALTVSGFEHTDGQVRVYLFSSKDGFPSKPERALFVRKEPLTGPELEFTYALLPYGEYAVSVHHDENGNDKLDANWMHIPKEPTGASNGARGRFGPPKFDKAKFSLNADTVRVTVTVK